MDAYTQLKTQQLDREIKRHQQAIKELRAKKATYAALDEQPADIDPDQSPAD